MGLGRVFVSHRTELGDTDSHRFASGYHCQVWAFLEPVKGWVARVQLALFWIALMPLVELH